MNNILILIKSDEWLELIRIVATYEGMVEGLIIMKENADFEKISNRSAILQNSFEKIKGNIKIKELENE